MDRVDVHFVEEVARWKTDHAAMRRRVDPAFHEVSPALRDYLLVALEDFFDAATQSRHVDLTARRLQAQGVGFSTVASAGHESNAGVALALRPTDPVLLHHRSGAFYIARARQVPGADPAADLLSSITCSVSDPISGGRQQLFGHHELDIIPHVGPTASHLPRAVGLAFAIGRGAQMGRDLPWPEDSVVLASFGDASANHSSARGAFNTAAWCAHQDVPLPLLLLCEDNGFGISARTPPGWTEASLSSLPGISYHHIDGERPVDVLSTAAQIADEVRTSRRPAIVHLDTMRYGGHTGADVELGYRSAHEIRASMEHDPLLALAATLVASGRLTPDAVLLDYEEARTSVAATAAKVLSSPQLSSAATVMAPLVDSRPSTVRRTAGVVAEDRVAAFRGKLPESGKPLSLAGSINAALTDILAAHPDTVVFGQDVGIKGGRYGLTRGLRKRFGVSRVFDTLCDEQSVIGTALGAALAGFVPIAELPTLAALHDAESLLRSEAAALAFFTAGQYQNGMVVRVPGLAHLGGRGGHLFNENSVSVLRDIPGVAVAVPSHPAEAADLLRACVGLARAEGRVCIFLEPTALYHRRDLLPADGRWTAAYTPPSGGPEEDQLGRISTYGRGEDLLMVTFGNGVPMSLLAAERLRLEGVAVTVADMRWLSPLPELSLRQFASRYAKILVVDETRRSGGVSEGVVACLVDGGFVGTIARVTSLDSFIPAGPASSSVTLSEDEIVTAALQLLGR